VLDRSGLEEGACECYAVVRTELLRLLSDVRYRQIEATVTVMDPVARRAHIHSRN